MKFFELYQQIQSQSVPKLQLWGEQTGSFRSWLMNEVAKTLVRDLESWQDKNAKELPFHSLFDKEGKKTRIVVPFKGDPVVTSILDKIKDAGLEIDFEKGVVTDGKRATRLGKYILGDKSPFDASQKHWWTRSGNPIDALKAANEKHRYAIIVSRNPVDIVRMSDHDGWTSCHSPSGMYFQCAVSDAKGAGAIAYVVRKDDLADVPDLQGAEIFSDKSRGLSGIRPLARTRLRKFVHKKDGYDLAVPEDRVYGNEFPGFKESIRTWALESQQDKLQGDRPRMKDFHLMGGSYQDTVGSKLFNYMFNDDRDSGEADYGGEDDHSSMADQYQEEVDQIQEEFKDKFSICYFYASVEEGDGQPYVYYSGTIMLEVPEELMKKSAKTNDSQVKKAIKEWARNNDIYTVNDIEVEGNKVRIDIYDEGGNNDPDSFRSFLEGTLTDIEKKKEELESGIYGLFVQWGLAHANRAYDINDDIDTYASQFTHFTLESEEPNIVVELREPIELPAPDKNAAGYQHEYDYWQKQFSENLIKMLNAWADRIVQSQRSQPTLFPQAELGIEYKKPFSSEFKIMPEIAVRSIGWQKSDRIGMYMTLTFKPLDNDEHIDDALVFLKFLDQNYDKFVDIVYKNYQEWDRRWKQHLASGKNNSNITDKTNFNAGVPGKM